MDVSTVPSLLPRWSPDLEKSSPNDFQSIRKLAFSQRTTENKKTPPADNNKAAPLTSSPLDMKTQQNKVTTPPKTLGRFVHFLRCSLCGMESINKTRFDSHLPCSQTAGGDHHYFLHTCSVCFACSTSRSLMDEHVDLFHKGIQVELIQSREALRPSAAESSASPSTLSPTSVATNTTPSSISPPCRQQSRSIEMPKRSYDDDLTGCLDLSTTPITTAAPTSDSTRGTPSRCQTEKNGAEGDLKKCHICSAELAGSLDELARHLALAHLIPIPLVFGQMAALAAAGQKGSPPSSLFPPPPSFILPPPPPPPPPPTLSRGTWDLPGMFGTTRERLPSSFQLGPSEGKNPQRHPFPLGSRSLLGLNFDLSQLQCLQANGDSSADEPQFKRVRMDASPSGFDGVQFLSRFPPLDNRFPPAPVHAGLPSSPYPGLSTALPFCFPFNQPPTSNAKASPVKNNHPAQPPTENRSRSTEDLTPGASAPPGIVHNTLRKTKSDMKVIHRYFVQVKNDSREIHEMPPQDLCKYIQDFIVTAKKKDGHEYEPESLKAFVHSLERHLKYHSYPHSVLKDPEFAAARMVLSQRLNELRALSQANGSSSTNRSNLTDPNKSEVSFSDVRFGSKITNPEALMQSGLLGTSNPQALLNSIWLIVRTQFNVVGTQKHRTLTWGKFQCVSNANSQDLLQFTARGSPPDVRFCHGHGGPTGVRAFEGQESGGCSKRQTLPFDCVEIFNLYARLRPLNCRGSEEPLYLCPDPAWDRGGPWFKTAVAGAQLLSRIPRILGMKPPREPPSSTPPTQSECLLRIPPPTLPFVNSPIPPSFSQLREDFLTTMNSFLAKSDSSSSNQIPPSFLNPQAALTPENLSLLAATVAQFHPPLLNGAKMPESLVEAKAGWTSPASSSLDSSADAQSASSPKCLPPAPLGNTDQNPAITP